MRQAQDDPNIKYIVTYGHRPAYSTGYHPGEAQIASILDGFGQTYSKYVLNINGHSHDYERFQPIQGVTHVTVGAPSSLETPVDAAPTRAPRSAPCTCRTCASTSARTGLKLQAVCDSSASKEDMTCTAGSVIDEYVIGTPPVLPVATDFYVDKTSPACSDSGQRHVERAVLHRHQGREPPAGRQRPLHRRRHLRRDDQAVRVGHGERPDHDHELARPQPRHRHRRDQRCLHLGEAATSPCPTSPSRARSATASTSRRATTSPSRGNTVTNAGRQAQGSHRPRHQHPRDERLARRRQQHQPQQRHRHLRHEHLDRQHRDATTSRASTPRAGSATPTASTSRSPGNVVSGNVTHDNEDSGIQLYTGGNNNLVTLNVTYNNGDHGIDNLNVTGGTDRRQHGVPQLHQRHQPRGDDVGQLPDREQHRGRQRRLPGVRRDRLRAPRRQHRRLGLGAQHSTLVDHNLVYLSKTGVDVRLGHDVHEPRRDADGLRAGGRRRPGRPEVRRRGRRGTSSCARAPRPSTAATAACPASRPPTSSATRACATPTSPTPSRRVRASTTTSAPTSSSPTCSRPDPAAGRRPDADADHREPPRCP